MAEKEDMNIVIVGHVDHGKSTLIGRLFYDTDSLPEEKKAEIENIAKEKNQDIEFAFVMDYLEEERDQGVTIDTTQTYFQTKKRNYTIIDAPGHKEFLKNMITGASQAEAAILIVDADEGVSEQTRRHSYILRFLGIQQIIVVLNKMDLVDYKESRYEEVKSELNTFFKKIAVKPSFYTPISAKKGDNVAEKSENMDWYDGKTILQALDTFSKLELEEKVLRLPVQDVYKIDNKRITVGRVESGTIRQGQEIILQPSETETKVKSIEVFEEERTEASAGESIGITTEDPIFIDRGQVICPKEQPATPTNKFIAEIFWMSKNPIKEGDTITLKCATQEVKATIANIKRKINSSTLEMIEENTDTIEETEAAETIIETKEPIVVELFQDIQELGRFVLTRDAVTVAGGIIRKKS